MTSRSRYPRWIAFLFIALSVIAGQFLLPSHLFAQAGSSDVLGTVTDSSGAVVVGAKVTIKDLGTSATRVATTDSNGGYIFNTLPNSQYTLTVEMQGFKTYTIAGFQLTAGERRRQDAKLSTGAVTETVQVTGIAAVMQTDTSEVSSTVAESAVQDLPLNNRSFESALQTQPGMSMGATSGMSSFASGQNPEDRRSSFVIVANGQSDSLNNELIDGFDNNERNLGLAGVRPSIDGIAEVKLDTSSYSAEYGRAAGAVVNVITKSGSNDFHGSLYEYFRNDITDASYYGFGVALPKAEYRLNSYGGSFGGPVMIPKLYNGKNKTFFFADWEGSRKVQGMSGSLFNNPTLFEEQSVANGDGLDLSDVLNTHPDAQGHYSCGSDNPSVNCDGTKDINYNWVPNENLDPVLKNYFLMLPAPNASVNQFTSVSNLRQNQVNFDARIDEHMGANDVLFGRFAYNPVSTLYPEEYPQITDATIANGTYSAAAAPLKGLYPGGYGPSGFPGPSNSTSYNSQFDYVHIFSSKLLLDLKAGFTRVNINSQPYNYNNGAAQQVGFAADVLNWAGNTLPSAGAWGVQEGAANSVPLADVNNTFQYAGSVTYTRGSHNLKLGGGFIRRQVNAFQDALVAGMWGFDGQPANGGHDPNHLFDARMNFIAGYPSMLMQSDALAKTGFRTSEYAGYVQDDWRLGRKLTVNMGVRYDIFTPFTEAHGNYTNFLLDCLTSNSIATDPNSCWVEGNNKDAAIGVKQDATVGVKTDYKDVSPRIGFAYSVDHATVIRAGFGMSYFPPDVGETSGGGPPSSVMENFNPPYTFNYSAHDYDSIWGAGCTMTNASGGTIGCFDQGPKVPSSDVVALDGYLTNQNISAASAKAPNLRSAYVMMMNMAVQRQFGARNSVTVAYVGELGRQMLRTFNADQNLPPGANQPAIDSAVYSQLPPWFNTITYSYNAASSSYHAMQLVYSRSLAQGLTVNANYTWSHNITDGGNIDTDSFYAGWNAKIDLGNSFMDLRHRVSVTAGYELPFGKNSKGFEAALIKGWKLNEIGYWETGSPFTVSGNYDVRLNNYHGGGRVDQIGNPNSGPKKLDNWFNQAAFALPQPGAIGTEMVNQVFGPHQRDVDVSLNKDFNIVEKLKAQFRAECFNISNTPNFASPNGGMSRGGPGGGGPNPDFGKITSVNYGSVPRQFQFALKLLF